MAPRYGTISLGERLALRRNTAVGSDLVCNGPGYLAFDWIHRSFGAQPAGPDDSVVRALVGCLYRRMPVVGAVEYSLPHDGCHTPWRARGRGTRNSSEKSAALDCRRRSAATSS